MSGIKKGLEELAQQRRQKVQQEQKNTYNFKEEDLDNFIEEDDDDAKKCLKKMRKHYIENENDSENDQEDGMKKEGMTDQNQQQITQFMGQKKKKKQTGIQLNDDVDLDQVIQQEKIEKVQIVQTVSNKEELYKAQFQETIQPKKKLNITEDDLDDLFSQLENIDKQKSQKKEEIKQENNSQQQQSVVKQQIQQKPQPVHRQIELKVDVSQIKQEQSTISFDQIKQGIRDITDIVEKNNSILFYWLDIYEDQIRFPGQLFVFGKVKNHKFGGYDSCTIFFDDYPKKIYLSYENNKYTEQELLAECQNIMKKYLSLGVKDYKTQFVNKLYAFEIADIPCTSSQYLEVSYTQKTGQSIPVRLDNSIFKYALQSTQTTIEQFLVYNKIRGPCWLLIKQCRTLDTKEFHIRTQHSLQVNQNGFSVCSEDIQPPQLKVLSISLKTCQLEKDNQTIAISCAVQNNIDVNDAEVPEQINYFTLARMPRDQILPPGYIKGKNKQIKDFESEYALLSEFLQFVEQVDPDALIGHDIYKTQLEFLFARIQKLKVTEWNRMSRLQKREQLPKNVFVRNKICTVGRLIVDTWLQASDMTKSTDYSLDYLSKQFLKQECKQIESDVTFEYTQSAQSYLSLLQMNAKEAKLTIQLMQKLNIISLTKQLTNIGGNIWNRSLINQRAERNEMLLMHEFYARGYLLPDRMSKINLSEEEREQQIRNQEQQKTYGGGLVFEPKADIYTQYVLLLDFNSLYPSIIMEFNICFTTVIRDKIKFEIDTTKQVDTSNTQSNKKKKKQKQKIEEEDLETQQQTDKDGNVVGEVDPDAQEGILPKIIETLVNMRKQAKKDMNKSTGLMKQIYNIKQLAVKLVANSIYGCLGFSSSRFYAVGIASLITKYGRKILMDSKRTVELSNDVIYGDTDSMMICARQQQIVNLRDVLNLGSQIAKEINKKYKKLVIGIDGVFETLLLLKKKKYAGIKIDNLDQLMQGEASEAKLKRETKGIDIVRREFCDLSKKMQSLVLDILLTTKNRETIFEDIHILMNEMRTMFDCVKGQLGDIKQEDLIQKNRFIKETFKNSDFIIVKQLSKAPHEYADKDNHPHVVVADRMVQNGKDSQSLVHHFIRYVICDIPSKNISKKAYTIDEMQELNYTFDYDYYLGNQIFEPIVRLCKNIQGLLISQMASILGLKSYQQKQKINVDNLGAIMEEEENELIILEDFNFDCPLCKDKIKYSTLFTSNTTVKEIKCAKETCKYELKHYKSIANQTRQLLKQLCQNYYQGHLFCEKGKESISFALTESCFGSCCERNIRKKLKPIIEESLVNNQVELIQMVFQKILVTINNLQFDNQQLKKQQYAIQTEKNYVQSFQQLHLNDLFSKIIL